jgi:hypothetical protein
VRRYRIPLILLGLFIVLLAVVLLTQNNSSSSTTAASATATPDPKAAQLQILNIPSSDATTKIEIKQTDPAKSVAFKYDNGKWVVDGPTSTELDTLTVANNVGQLNTLKGTALVNEKGDKLADYGLDKPALVINLTMPSGSTKSIQVGQQNPASKNYYVKLADDPRVWTVAPTLLDTVKGWLTTLPVPEATPTPFPTIPLSPLPPTNTPNATATAVAATATPAPTTAAATTAAPATTPTP